MARTGIVTSGVTRSFGETQAVADATLYAAPGRITGLVGPNGAGKTTLMLMLASLLEPDGGEIRINDVSPVTAPAQTRALIGWMPDGLGAWPTLTTRETLSVTARLYGMDRPTAALRADEMIRSVRLEELADRPARVLSRGQKQRLGLARALVHAPEVLILDEPASGLDPASRIQLRDMLRSFAAGGGTVLISSHVLSELEEMIDDAVFMRAGRIVDAPREASTGIAWRIRSAAPAPDDPDRIAAALGLTPGTIGVDRDAVVITVSSEAAAADALARIVAAGVPVAEFAPAYGRLERAFLAMENDR